MDNIIKLGRKDYTLTKNYKEAFQKEEVEAKYTDFFEDYDFLVGDYAYGKLRLKGFCYKKNRRYQKCNDYTLMDQYIQKDCAYECKYFILEKGE